MALSTHDIEFLAIQAHKGVLAGRILCVGRPTLLAQSWEVEAIFKKYGFRPPVGKYDQGSFAEPVLTALGAVRIESVDISDYEGADYIWDLNRAYSGQLRAEFDLIIDAGTLEHVFEFPTALRNICGWVTPGGHIMFLQHANNFMGHGFYQFSPELFFAFCDVTRGFEVSEMVIHENRQSAPWYKVKSPMETQARVTLCNRRQTFLKVVMERLPDVTLDRQSPIQADWQELHNASPRFVKNRSGLRMRLATQMARLFPRMVHRYRRWRIESMQERGFAEPWFEPYSQSFE